MGEQTGRLLWQRGPRWSGRWSSSALRSSKIGSTPNLTPRSSVLVCRLPQSLGSAAAFDFSEDSEDIIRMMIANISVVCKACQQCCNRCCIQHSRAAQTVQAVNKSAHLTHTAHLNCRSSQAARQCSLQSWPAENCTGQVHQSSQACRPHF